MPPPMRSPVLASGDFHNFGPLELPTGDQKFLGDRQVYGARGGKGRQARKVDNLIAICEPIV
jgi:hypothetical protein